MAAPHPTPMHSKASSNRSSSFHAQDDIDNFLKDDLRLSTVSVTGDAFLHFASLQTLWDSPDWSETVNRLTADETQLQLKRVWDGVHNKTDQYRPFCDWVEHLVQFMTQLPRGPARKIRFVPSNDKNLACGPGYSNGKEIEGTATAFKPDVVCMDAGVTELNKWSQVLVPIQFKKGRSSLTVSSSAVPQTSDSQTLAPPVTPPKSQSQEELKRSREGGDGKSGPQGKEAGISTIYDTHHFDSLATPSPRPDHYDPTMDDIRLARYAMETFAAVGDRTHVFALFVIRPNVTLWYVDRCGAVCTSALDIDDPDNFSVFLKFLSALVYMKDGALGFNPFFADSSTDAPAGTREKLFGLTLTIPDSNNATLTLQDVLDRRTGLVGRATLVCKAELRENGKEGRQERQSVVIKSSWQHSARIPEWDILRELHNDNQAQDHIVLFVYGWEQTGAQVSSRRAKFGQPTPSVVHDRALRHTVLEYLNPITQLSQPFHIPSIGWNIMQDSYWWPEAIKFLNNMGWFHGDISIGNMGFSLHPKCKAAVIKLHDFDLSKRHALNSGTSHWTGTVPFMSIELLEQTNAPHMIGFEVEALTWTLLWIVRVYTNGEDLNPVKDHPLKGWFANGKTLEQIASTKERHLKNLSGYTNEFYRELEDQFYDLAWLWDDMRQAQWVERRQKRDKVISEAVYGMTGFNKIEGWMRENGWDTPRRPCSCKQHCLPK
ncbi:hypothetical protein FRC01_000588 [Tulasnella sp. 417]|nr:hypothetical protein FRC01_000588 [Tulasnella sp. 417]